MKYSIFKEDKIYSEKIEIKEEKEGSKKRLNYKFWIIALSLLDSIFIILTFVFTLANKNDTLFWICMVLTVISSIVLIIFIFLKIKKDKNEEELSDEELVIIEEGEEEKLKELKNQIFENQKKSRETNANSIEMTEQEKNEKINEVLEDMCIFGEITKKEIKEQKQKTPEKFIETSEALKMEKEDEGLFALGLLSQNLENLGIETAIEKDENPEEVNSDLTSLQFLTNGMINKKKYDLHFEFGKKRNNELLSDKNEFEKFKEKLKMKLSKDYNIPPEKIIVTLPQKGSLRVQVIFQTEEFNNLNKNEFINKFKNDPEFTELSYLKDIQEEIICGGVKLSRNQLDPEGNRNDGWGIGEQRGGKDYYPPKDGWNGIGLKVRGKYDKGDDTWLGMSNSPGEWCVAYHGVGRRKNPEEVKRIVVNIFNDKFRPGQGQAHENCQDLCHPGKKVGIGVYCTPKIEKTEPYIGNSIVNGKKFKTVLMVRVKPKAIRNCSCEPYYWVVNGTTDEIRPYRILYKECK